MKRFRQMISLAFAALACAALTGCAAQPPATDGERIQIVTTLFPTYDFARQIAGERADVTLLLPPGMESHAYEPSPADIVRINRAGLFIYTGEQMEPWAARLVSGLEGDVRVVDASQGIPLDDGEDSHDHGEDSAAHGGDPHIWTSPVNAQKMVSTIAGALCEADPEGAEEYRANETAYLAQLQALDERFRQIVAQAKRRKIVFAGRFAFHYFAKEYGLEVIAAYDSCSSQTEPNARAVADIVDSIRADGLPAVYYEELVDPKTAVSIGNETGAKPLLLHSCHNVSRDDFQDGATYLSLMEQNAAHLEEGLN